MTITNISNKTIGLSGDSYILPGDTATVPKDMEHNPIFQTLRSLGLILINDAATGLAVNVSLAGVGTPAPKAEKPKTGATGAKNGKPEAPDKAALLAEINGNPSDERIGAIAQQLGVNPATARTQASLVKKIKTELSK